MISTNIYKTKQTELNLNRVQRSLNFAFLYFPGSIDSFQSSLYFSSQSSGQIRRINVPSVDKATTAHKFTLEKCELSLSYELFIKFLLLPVNVYTSLSTMRDLQSTAPWSCDKRRRIEGSEGLGERQSGQKSPGRSV